MFKHLLTVATLLGSAGIAQANHTALCSQEDGNCPLRLIEPDIASPINCGSTAKKVTYTVENDVFDVVELDLDIETIVPDDTSPGSTVAFDEDESSCFDTNPPSVPARNIVGPGTCTLVVVITPTDCAPDDFPEYIVRELIVTPLDIAQAPMTAPIEVEVDEFINFLAIAVAQSTVSDGASIAATSPLVVHDATGSWNLVTSGLSTSTFHSATCTGFDASGICIAGGGDSTGSGGASIPVLNNSTDGGQTWGTPTINLPALGEVQGVACTDEASSAICSAVGHESTTTKETIFDVLSLPIMYRSTDGGANWTSLGLPATNTNSELRKTACAGNVCVAIGNENNDPILFVAIGTTVSRVTLATNIKLNGTACTQSSGKVICTVVGEDASNNAYLLVNPDVAGVGTWTNWTSTIAGQFNATACATKSDNKVVCTAVGGLDMGLYVNTDVTGSGSWIFKQAGHL